MKQNNWWVLRGMQVSTTQPGAKILKVLHKNQLRQMSCDITPLEVLSELMQETFSFWVTQQHFVKAEIPQKFSTADCGLLQE